MGHLATILQVSQGHHSVANAKKCSFGLPQIKYLGHIVSGHAVATDPQKISAMVHWSIPTNLKEIRRFLGPTGYYLKFVVNYDALASPLTQLLKRDKFLWSEVATKTFENLKVALTSIPILGLPYFSRLFIIESDALGMGCVM